MENGLYPFENDFLDNMIRSSHGSLGMSVKGSIIFLPPEGGFWNLGEHMNFGNQKGGTEEFFGTLRRQQKNFTDPIPKKLKSKNINLFWKNVT